MTQCSCATSRRDFLASTISCGSWVALSLAAADPFVRSAFAAPLPTTHTVNAQPFARIDRLADGVYAVIATPEGGTQVVSNAGIIAGKDATLVIEGQNTVAGGAWLSNAAKQLTGRYPTHLVLTHFHADHSGGLAGHLNADANPAIISTNATRHLLIDKYIEDPKYDAGVKPETPLTTFRRVLVPDTVLVHPTDPVVIDLGRRSVTLTPRAGHTPSDLTITIDDPAITWCGDLVFNGLFPYYGDAIPSVLTETCKRLLDDPDMIYVPGHGSIADADGLRPYLDLLADVERAARNAVAKGVPASDAWRNYSLPASLVTWTRFRPDVFRFAFEAWERELRG
ncbi:MAG: MBL fold metallo-hydrolase [Phycisphaerales bacterium]